MRIKDEKTTQMYANRKEIWKHQLKGLQKNIASDSKSVYLSENGAYTSVDKFTTILPSQMNSLSH